MLQNCQQHGNCCWKFIHTITQFRWKNSIISVKIMLSMLLDRLSFCQGWKTWDSKGHLCERYPSQANPAAYKALKKWKRKHPEHCCMPNVPHTCSMFSWSFVGHDVGQVKRTGGTTSVTKMPITTNVAKTRSPPLTLAIGFFNCFLVKSRGTGTCLMLQRIWS